MWVKRELKKTQLNRCIEMSSRFIIPQLFPFQTKLFFCSKAAGSEAQLLQLRLVFTVKPVLKGYGAHHKCVFSQFPIQ